MLDFKIDQDKCTQCGECARDCFVGIIKMDPDYPTIAAEDESKCIQCQHCLAICKPGALSIFGKDQADSSPLKGNMPSGEQMETLIMGRRTTRHFKQKPVEPAMIDRMLEVVRHAPTGVNRQTTLFTVVDDKDVMDVLRERSMAVALDALDGRLSIPERLKPLLGYFEACRDGQDVIFRGAPHLLVTSAPKSNPSGPADCLIALSYFELLANSQGIGTVWDGIAKTVLTMVAPDLGKMLGIPEDHEIGHMIAFGKPAVKYHRTVQRVGGSVSRVKL